MSMAADASSSSSLSLQCLWNSSSSSNSATGAIQDMPLATWALLALLVWLLVSKLQDWQVLYQLQLQWEYLTVAVPAVEVPLTDLEARDDGNLEAEQAAHQPKTTRSLRDPAQPDWIQCYDPATGDYLGRCKAMNADDVRQACQKAAAAQPAWALTTFRQRRAVLRTLQRYIVEHVDDICRVASRDSGKPVVDACLGEVLTTTEKIRCLCSQGELWLQPSFRPTGPLLMHKTAAVEYVPLGVVAPIAPWNYPFHNYINHILSGLFAGNAVVGKVSEHSAWSSQYFTRMVQACLRVHGHDPDLVQTVTGFAEAGAALVADPAIDKIIFTGSPAVGKKVMEGASQHLKPVILELGGKDAMVILEDCQLSGVLPWVMRGCFQNCGQNCVGIERVLVYEALYDDFVKAVVPLVEGLRQGVPLQTTNPDSPLEMDVGAMVMDAQIDHIQELIDDAVRHGAKVLCGGKRNPHFDAAAGQQFYLPTIVADVTPGMRIFQQELFGPVLTLVKVPDNDDATAVQMVNDSPFGLGCSVYSGNKARGLAVGRQIRSGMCCINDFGSNYLVQSLPFGGVGDSGFGRFAGPEGLRALTLERAILTDRFPGVATTIPPPLQYPVDQKNKGLPFANSLIQLFYNESWIGKLKGIVGLIKFGN